MIGDTNAAVGTLCPVSSCITDQIATDENIWLWEYVPAVCARASLSRALVQLPLSGKQSHFLTWAPPHLQTMQRHAASENVSGFVTRAKRYIKKNDKDSMVVDADLREKLSKVSTFVCGCCFECHFMRLLTFFINPGRHRMDSARFQPQIGCCWLIFESCLCEIGCQKFWSAVLQSEQFHSTIPHIASVKTNSSEFVLILMGWYFTCRGWDCSQLWYETDLRHRADSPYCLHLPTICRSFFFSFLFLLSSLSLHNRIAKWSSLCLVW